MKIFFTALLSTLFIIPTFSQSYRFTGNGNWSDTANWLNRRVPPRSISQYDAIVVTPMSSDSCVLDVTQTVLKGGRLTVNPGVKFIIPGDLLVIDPAPLVITTEVFGLSGCQATAGGQVVSYIGLRPVTVSGLVWGNSPNPDITGRKTTDGISSGNFYSTMTNLLYDTTYYVRAYATNEIGTGYGNEIMFKSAKLLNTLSTNQVSSITSNTATSGGIFTGAICIDNIYYVGVVWDTNPNPTLELPTQTFGSFMITGNTLSYTSNITDLLPNTTYYVRAYIKFITGAVYYGNAERTFTTP